MPRRPRPPAADDAYRTPRMNLVAIGLLALVSLAAALGILVAFTGGDGAPAFPPGYFGEVARISQEAESEIGRAAPAPDLRAACLNDDAGGACATYGSAADAVAIRVGRLIGRFEALRPPSPARAWHDEYRNALLDLHEGFRAQAEAITARDLPAFRRALATGDEAVAREIALSERFNVDFAPQLS